MREILFKGKRTDNGEWLQGYIIVAEKDTPYIIPSKSWAHAPRNSHSIYSSNFYRVDPETVGQYTGLTDKNGTKIFEGDILKQKTTSKFAEVSPFEWERYGVVRFGYHDWGDKNEVGYASEGWYIQPLRSVSVNPKNYGVGYIKPGLNQCDILDEYYPMEVIGNIHDNPELLKGGVIDE